MMNKCRNSNINLFLILIFSVSIFACKQKTNSELVTEDLEIKSSIASATDDQTLFYLVRHAEKMKQVEDPGLTAEGVQRAKDLSDFFKTVDLKAVYSTNYKRTKLTAKETAKQHGLKTIIYDSVDTSFAEQLKRDHKGQQILIVGHSNSTPELANLLSGTSKLEHYSENEYDKLLIVDIGDEKAKVISMTYGVSNN